MFFGTYVDSATGNTITFENDKMSFDFTPSGGQKGSVFPNIDTSSSIGYINGDGVDALSGNMYDDGYTFKTNDGHTYVYTP